MYDSLVCSGKGSSTEAIEVSWKNMSELELWMELLHHLSYIKYQTLILSLTLWLSPQLLQKFTPGNTSLHSQLQDRDLICNGSVECLWYYKIIRKNHRPQLYLNRFLILGDIMRKYIEMFLLSSERSFSSASLSISLHHPSILLVSVCSNFINQDPSRRQGDIRPVSTVSMAGSSQGSGGGRFEVSTGVL